MTNPNDIEVKDFIELSPSLEEPKQETLEEAALDYSGYEEHRMDFIAGAKWQQERMYSEEEVLELLIKFNQEIQEVEDVRIWFEQFKKK